MEGSSKNTEGIKVAIRMRPLNEREANSGQEKIFRCLTQYNAVSQVKDGQPLEGMTSYFDKVFDESAHNCDVYSYIGKEIVQGVMAGINGTVFAYGQTSSGKTHTMLGGGEEKGVVYQAAEDIFSYIANNPNRDFLLRASFVEIYNENIRDLLSENPDATVSIREDPRKGVYCEAVEFVITDFDSILKLLKKGIARRVVEATAMNDTSSRSHTIFRLVVESRESARPGFEADGAVLVSALNLVDLAGSESVRHTGAMGQRAKEGGKINQSLLSLSRVIHSLSQPGAHVNFRDSKLTRLLQPSLCGNAKMAIVCCITAAQNYLEETRSTLAFASRAKLVVTHAKVNEVLDESSQIRRLKKELEVLKEAYLQASSLSPEEVARLQSEKADLEAQVSQLKEQMEAQRIVISELNSSTSSTSSDSDAETVPEELDIPRPKRKRSSASSMYLEDQENIPPSNESQTMLQQEIDRKNQLIENISSELAQARKEIENLKEELESSGTTVMLDREFDLMAEKSALQGERDRLCEEVNDLQTTVQKLKEELLEANINQTKARHEPQEEAQLTELVLQMGAMEENLTAAQMSLQEKDEIISTLQAKIQQQMEECEAKMASLSDQLTHAEKEVIANKEKANELENELIDVRASYVHNKSILDAALQASQLAREKAEDDLHVMTQKVSSLTTHLQALQQEILQTRSVVTQQDLAHEAWQGKEHDLMQELEQAKQAYLDAQSTVNELREQVEQERVRGEDKLHELSRLSLEQQDRLTSLEIALSESKGLLENAQEREKLLTEKLEDSQRTGEELAGCAEQLNEKVRSIKNQLSAVEEEKTSLTCTVSQQQGQLEEAQQSLQQLQGQLHEIEEERTRLADQVQMLQQNGDAGMQELHAQILSLQESLRMAEQGLEVLQAEKVAARDELIQLQQQVEEAAERELSLQEQLLGLEEGKLQLEKAASELAEQVNMMQSQLSGAEEREQSLQEQLSQLQQESDDLKARLQSQQTQQVTSLGRLAELELSQETLDQARRELQVQLEAMMDQLRAVESDYSKAMNENDDLKTRLVAAEQGLAQFTQQTNCLLDTEGAMKKRCSQLQTENDLLRGEKDSLSSKIKAMEVSLAQSEYQASSQQEKQTQQLQESEKKVKALQEELNAMRMQADSLKAAEQTIAMLRAEAKSLKDEHGRLLQSFDELRDGYEEQKNQLDRLEGVNPERVIALEGELATLKEDLKEYSQRYAQTQSDYTKLQEELEGTLAERDEAMREIEGTAERLQELTQALEEAEVQLEEMEGQKSALETQVSEIERLYEDCQHSLLAAEGEREEVKKLLQRASEEVASLTDKLFYHDKEASREQEAIMEAAEMQMDGLRAQIAHLEQVVAAERKEKAALVQAEEQLLIRVDKLMKALQEKEQEAGPKIDPAQVEKVQKLLLQKEQEILSLQRSLDNSTEEVLALQATLREKEARIVHLDASKLTRDQMEKIKAIKEERNKYSEGYKSMKKQLASLKQAYDSLKQSSEAQAAGPSQEFHISDLKFQIAELNGQLERSGEVTALLKEKLKECSAQLEDYEKERDAVLSVLDKHGIDTRGLQINDFSTATSSAGVGAGAVQDLGEAVALLAQTIIDRQSSSVVKSKAISEELASTQAQLQTLLLEGAETAAAKAALEKRIDALKQSLRTLREENAEQAAQLAHLLTEKKTLSEQLVEAQRKALTNGEASSSEVQVLEEENLELMRENKDLRVELSKVRSQLSASSAPSHPVPLAVSASAAPVANSAVPPSAHKVGQKRAFGTELDTNAPVQPSPAPSKMSKVSSTPAAAAGEENAAPADVAKAMPRRVKAHTVKASSEPAETPECTQS